MGAVNDLSSCISNNSEALRSGSLLFALQLGAAWAPAQTTFVRHFGGDGSDIGFCVERTADGGYILSGGSETDGTASMDMYLVRTDAAGNEQWSRTFGTSMIEFAYSVVGTADGGFVVCGGWAGFGADTLALVKVDATGADQWSRRYPINVDRSIGYSVTEAENGDLLCSGFAGPYGAQDAAFIRVGPDGEPVWTTLVDLGANNAGTAIRSTADGGAVALVTSFESYGVDGDIGLVRLNSSGDTLWTRSFATPALEDAHGMTVAGNGDVLIAGFYGAVPADAFLMRTDANGGMLWSHTYGSLDGHDEALDVEALDNGDILVTGRTQPGADDPTGMLLMRCDAEGGVQWQHAYVEGIMAASQSVCVAEDGGFAMLGYTALEADSTFDLLLVKTNGSGFTAIADGMGTNDRRFDLFPVPADVSARLAITGSWPGPFVADLLDAWGRRAMRLTSFTGTLDIPCSTLPTGSYILLVSDAQGRIGRTKLQVAH